jgi:hypothetical protein
MGTLKTNTVQKANGDPVDLTGQQGAKAWVNVDGTGTISVRDSLNVSSITDLGSGNYGYTFTNDFDGVDYSHIASGSNENSVVSFTSGAVAHVLTSSCRIYAWTSTPALADTSQAIGTVHGGLA